MGRIGKVIKSYIDKLSGSSNLAQFGSVEEFAGDERKVQYFGPCNEDFAPPENCKTLNIPLGRGRGFLISAAYHNQNIDPAALPGERRLYSTNQAGDTIIGEIYLKRDGTILVKIGAVTIIEISSTKVTINKDVDIVGTLDITEIITGSNVFGGADSDVHIHPQGNDSDGDTEQDTGGPQ